MLNKSYPQFCEFSTKFLWKTCFRFVFNVFIFIFNPNWGFPSELFLNTLHTIFQNMEYKVTNTTFD